MRGAFTMSKRTADRMRVLYRYCGIDCISAWAVARSLGNGCFSATFDAHGEVEVIGVEFDTWRYGFNSKGMLTQARYLPPGDSITIVRTFQINATERVKT